MSALARLVRVGRPVRRWAATATLPARLSHHYTTLTYSTYNTANNHIHSTQPRRYFAADAAAGQQLSRKEIEDRVLEVVKKFPKVEQSKVSPTAVFSTDLGLDSLDAVELVMELEEEFKIEINDQDADKITSVKDAIEHISKNADAR